MSASVTFKCPGCGGYLEFDPDGQHFECPYCGQEIGEEELRRLSKEKEAAAEMPDEPLKSYHCQMCGAEIVTGDTTAATRCYYCHNPVILADRLSDEFRPDGVIPFRLDKQQAEAQFKQYVSKKRFIDREFFSGAQLEDFSGVYYPYWYGDLALDAEFEGEGKRVSRRRGAQQTVITTRYFRVQRAGRLQFRNLVRKALSTADRKLSDGVHPYNLADEKPFATGYLSGFLAERRDVEKAAALEEMTQEAKGYAGDMIKRGTQFDSLNGSTNASVRGANARNLLLPAWVLTYKGAGKDPASYYYMMNGQTGSVCGKLPVNKGKLWLWAAATGAAVTALLCLGGALLW